MFCVVPVLVYCSGFGVPNRRRRIFIVASMHGDARDVLLGQVSPGGGGGRGGGGVPGVDGVWEVGRGAGEGGCVLSVSVNCCKKRHACMLAVCVFCLEGGRGWMGFGRF